MGKFRTEKLFQLLHDGKELTTPEIDALRSQTDWRAAIQSPKLKDIALQVLLFFSRQDKEEKCALMCEQPDDQTIGDQFQRILDEKT